MKTKFFTGVGDAGVSNTGNQKVSKDDPIFMLLGSLDECTSWLGLARVSADEKIAIWLKKLQEMLFISQAEVATIAFGYGKYTDEVRKFPYISNEHLKVCEEMITVIDEELPELKNFILPGGSEVSAQCDIARTIARKAERYATIVNSRKLGLSADLLAFLNRLSSVLFAIARYVNFIKKIPEDSPKYS